MKYFEEAKAIWHEFVPKSGQAATEQGELLRAVEKLRDEAERNGNGNWDQGFEILLSYLHGRLTDAAVFTAEVRVSTSAALDRLAKYTDPYLGDDLYDELGDRVVEYFRHYGSRPHIRNPDLLR